MLLPAASASLGALVLLGAALGTALLCVALVGLTGIFLGSWHRCVGAPGARGGAAVAAAAATASLLLLLGTPVLADPPRPLTPVAPVLGIALALAFVHQLMREPPRDRVVASMTATTAATVLACLGTLALPAHRSPGGTWLLAAAVVAGAGGALILATSLTPAARTVLAVLVGAGLGLMVEVAAPGQAGFQAGGTAQLAGVLVGAGTAVAAVVAAAVAGPAPAVSSLGAAGALPVLFAGPLTYLVGTVLAPAGAVA